LEKRNSNDMIRSTYIEFIELLINDKEFLEFFVTNPKQALGRFDVTLEQEQTLLARTPNDLLKLGIDKSPLSGIIW